MATQKQVFTEITESIDRCNHTLPGLIQFLKNGFKKLENASGGGGGGSTVAWTQTQAQATGTKIAEIEIDGDTTNVYAPAVSATQIQSTGTKIASLTIGGESTDLYAPTTSVSVQAEDVAYSNTVSGLTADNCQEAIDELKSLIPGASGSVSVTADGVKTYSALFNELYDLIDKDKISAQNVLYFGGAVFLIANYTESDVSFTRSYVTGSSAVDITAVLKASSSIYRQMTMASSGNTFADNSAQVLSNGTVITFYY